MLEATGGSNSHKGAIWTLGLLVSALACMTTTVVTASAIAVDRQRHCFFRRSCRASSGVTRRRRREADTVSWVHEVRRFAGFHTSWT